MKPTRTPRDHALPRCAAWRFWLLLSVGLLLVRAATNAATPATVETKMHELEIAVDQAMPTPSPNQPKPPQASEALAVVQSNLLKIRVELSSLTAAQLANQLTSGMGIGGTNRRGSLATYNADDKVNAAEMALVAEVKALREEETAQAQLTVQQLCTKAMDVAIAAQTAAELDPILLELSKQSPLRHEFALLPTPPEWGKADGLRDLLLPWQEYLSDRDRGAVEDQNDKADYTVGRGSWDGFTPEQTLALKKRVEADPNRHPLAVAVADCEKLQLPDDLPGAIQAILHLQAPSKHQTMVDRVRSVLETLKEYYDELQTGEPLPLKNHYAPRFSDQMESGLSVVAANVNLARLSQHVLLLNLARQLDAPENLLPRLDESYVDYLTRYVPSQLHTADDWQRLRRVLALGTLTMFDQDPPGWHQADVEACDTYLLALTNDRAKQWRDAIVFYLRTQRIAAPHLPNDAIGQRLSLLKKLEPADYAAAIELLNDDSHALDLIPPKRARGTATPQPVRGAGAAQRGRGPNPAQPGGAGG